jgi:hypothetical protein
LLVNFAALLKRFPTTRRSFAASPAKMISSAGRVIKNLPFFLDTLSPTLPQLVDQNVQLYRSFMNFHPAGFKL